MQCTSFTPVYYHPRDLNARASGYSWHLYDSNASYGEERSYNISMPQFDQYSVYDKEALKQIIQNHEATFRYQVQELHRLYKRQRDLMDETRMREIFAHRLVSRTSESIHSLSHAGAEFSHNRSPATNWLFGNLASSKLSELRSGDVQGHKNVVAENLEESTALLPDSFIRKNSINDVQFLSPSCKQTGIGTVSLELAADMYHDDQRKQFEVGNLSKAHELKHRAPAETSNFQPASNSDFASTNTWNFSCSSSNIRKTNCFIDLNEPTQLEPGYNKTVSSDEFVPVDTLPESIVPTQSQLLKSNDSCSNGANSSITIDLNSLPVNYSSETEMTLESPGSMKREAQVALDCSSAYNHAIANMKTETYIDLNTGVVDDHSLPSLQIKSVEDTELKGPVSPENMESSPPRGKSEDNQLDTPLSSQQGEREPFIEVDTVAAQTLVKMGAAVFDTQANFRNLCWFAEFVSFSGDDLETKVMEFENDQGEENALNLSHFNKSRATGTMSRRSEKGQKRGKKRCKDFQMEEALGPQECLKPGQSKREAGKTPCARKTRKYSKLSTSDVTKKSLSSILKQSAARVDQCVLQSWGKIRKRQGGRRRRASTSFSLAELALF